jgi:hypothetical protein
MSRAMNLETFFFGLATGIACVAAVQYLVSLTGVSNNYNKQYLSSIHDQDEKSVKHVVRSQPSTFEPSRPSNSLTPSVLASLDEKLVVTSSRLQKIVLHMVSEFKKGLASENEVLKMLPSYVTKRPTGISSPQADRHDFNNEMVGRSCYSPFLIMSSRYMHLTVL